MDIVDGLAGLQIHSKEGHDLWVVFATVGAFLLLHFLAYGLRSQSSSHEKSQREVAKPSHDPDYEDVSSSPNDNYQDIPNNEVRTVKNTNNRLASVHEREQNMSKRANYLSGVKVKTTYDSRDNRAHGQKPRNHSKKKKRGRDENTFKPQLFLPKTDAYEGWFGSIDGTRSSDLRLCIAYEDGKQQESVRIITVHRFRETESGMILSGFCYERLTSLTFIVSRIKAGWNPETGEKIDDIESYIRAHSP